MQPPTNTSATVPFASTSSKLFPNREEFGSESAAAAQPPNAEPDRVSQLSSHLGTAADRSTIRRGFHQARKHPISVRLDHCVHRPAPAPCNTVYPPMLKTA